MQGAQQLAILQERFGQGVLAGARLQPRRQQRGGDVAELERAGDAEQLVPVLVDQIDLGVAC